MLDLICRESPAVALSHQIKVKEVIFYRGNFSGVIFVVNRYECFMKNKNIIRTFCDCNYWKKEDTHRYFTGSYKTE